MIAPDTVTLIQAAQAGDKEACGRLVEENLGLIWSIVKRYTRKTVDNDDLYQLGCLGFLKAVQGFDTQFGTQFSTYAVPKIAGEIRRFLRDDGPVKVSRGQKEQALVRSMRPGERIAIKAAYVRKHGLPFDNRQQTVSVMGIKAIGIISENPQDGERVKVQWQPADGVREWYFYTYRPTIWRVVPGEWNADALIEFAFNGKPQDIERFRNAPYWKDRFGTLFQWADFYEAIAEKLLAYASNRVPLIQGIHQIAQRVQGLGYLQDKFPDGSSGPLQDICPFTVMGTFNRGMTDANRKLIAAELAKLLGVTVPVPATFEGIPVLNNQRSWFFRYADKRGAGDIDALWRVFAAAQALVEAVHADVERRHHAGFLARALGQCADVPVGLGELRLHVGVDGLPVLAHLDAFARDAVGRHFGQGGAPG